MTTDMIWHGAKIELDDGNLIHIAFTYPKSIETFFNEWLEKTNVKEEWSFLEYLNSLWKGKYIAITLDHFEFLNADPALMKKDEWAHAYFEMSNGTKIDIMHNIPGPKKNELIKGAIEGWILRAEEHTEKSFIDHFNRESGFKAVPRILFQHLN